MRDVVALLCSEGIDARPGTELMTDFGGIDERRPAVIAHVRTLDDVRRCFSVATALAMPGIPWCSASQNRR